MVLRRHLSLPSPNYRLRKSLKGRCPAFLKCQCLLYRPSLSHARGQQHRRSIFNIILLSMRQTSRQSLGVNDAARARKAVIVKGHANDARMLALVLRAASVRTRAMGVKVASDGIWVYQSRRSWTSLRMQWNRRNRRLQGPFLPECPSAQKK